MGVADEGELEQNFLLLFAFHPGAHVEQCQQAVGERHHDQRGGSHAGLTIETGTARGTRIVLILDAREAVRLTSIHT